MVGKWTPEPPRDFNENLCASGGYIEVIEIDSTDSEDEETAHTGYEPLPQQLPVDQPDSENEDVDDTENGGDNFGPSSTENTLTAGMSDDGNSGTAQLEQCKFEVERHADLKEVWSAPGSSNIEMGTEQAEQVRAAMANFALPSSSIPAWARAVPEDQWKQQLLERIQKLQQRQDEQQPKS